MGVGQNDIYLSTYIVSNIFHKTVTEHFKRTFWNYFYISWLIRNIKFSYKNVLGEIMNNIIFIDNYRKDKDIIVEKNNTASVNYLLYMLEEKIKHHFKTEPMKEGA